MVGKSLLLPIKRRIYYLLHYQSNVESAKNEAENLRPVREQVQLLIDEAQRRGEVLDPAVQDWVMRFDNIGTYMSRLDNEVEDGKTCFKGCFLGCSSRYRLSKEATKRTIILNELRRDGNFSTVSYPPHRASAELVTVGDFEAFSSIKVAMEMIIEALNDEKISIIGVSGMGGVGKTTLVKEVGKLVKMEKAYDFVIMVTVSRNPNMKRIQREVAEELGMELEEEGASQRASRLFMRIKQEKRILIILDDLWGTLELHEVGIPYGKDHKGCKIVLTSRSAEVCNAMECQQEVRVGVLSENDSWELFRREAGGVVYSHRLQDTAWKVAKECEGFLIAIVTLGRALRNKEPLYWVNTLWQLKNSVHPAITDVHAKVFTSVRLSYESLESEETKLLFLLCCIFPEDTKIDANLLMIYGMGEGLVRDVGTLEEARRRVHNLIFKLKDCCLLLDGNEDYTDEDGNEETSVRLHDVVRDVAISIAAESGQGFQMNECACLKGLKTENLGGYKRISLMNCGIVSLCEDWPESPHLLTLLLRDNGNLMNISDHFFESMKGLLVLDLTGTGISSLPPSLSCLLNLRALCLDQCHMLTDICSVGGLKKLEILRLNGSGICELSEEIGHLTNLMLLDLRGTGNLKRVAPNVMPLLSRLEELYMEGSFREWEFEGVGDGSKASFNEIGSLSCLNHLYVDIKDEEFLSSDISGPWKNLTQFRLSVGYTASYENEQNFRRAMRVHKIAKPISHWGRVLLEKTENLFLESCNIDGVENLRKFIFGPLPPGPLVQLRFLYAVHCMKLMTIFTSEIQKTLHNLEHVLVLSCEEVRVIFHCDEGMAQEQAVLCRLREVILFDLKKLMSIWKGPIPHGVAHNLQVLHVVSCRSLRFLFSPVIAQSLQKLERLELFACSNIENLISDEEDMATSTAEAASSFSQLQKGKCHQPSIGTFQNLRVLEVEYNKALKSLFPLHLARALRHLNKLKLSCCYGMEEMISTEDGDVVDAGIFPLLRNLHLEMTPKLVRFYGGEVLLDWPSLECITVVESWSLRSLPIGLQSAPKLETIKAEMSWFRQLEWKEHGVKKRLQSIAEEYKPW